MVESDSITAGKCWGSHENPGTPISVPASFRFSPVDVKGTAGVRRGDTLVDQTVTQVDKTTVTTSWSLTLVTQAKPQK